MTLLHTAGGVAAEMRRRLLLNTIALGAETDIGRAVYQGRRTVDKSLVPCTTLLEGDDELSRRNQVTTTEYVVEQHFAILSYNDCDPADPNVAAHAAIRDVKRCLFNTDGKADVRLGGHAVQVEYLGKQIGPRADGEAFVLTIVEVVVKFIENVAAP